MLAATPSRSTDPMAATAALSFHPAAFSVSAHPREAAAATTKQPLRHCSPLRSVVPRRTCLLRARSSNGRPQISASFGNSNEVLDGMPTGDGPPAPGQGGSTVSITVVGASGDLAKKKIFPALFALFYEDCLPEHFTVFGYARSKMSDEELRNMISTTLTCRIDKRYCMFTYSVSRHAYASIFSTSHLTGRPNRGNNGALYYCGIASLVSRHFTISFSIHL